MKKKIYHFFSTNLSIKGFVIFIIGIIFFIANILLNTYHYPIIDILIDKITLYYLLYSVLGLQDALIVSGICMMSISAAINMVLKHIVKTDK